MSCGSSGSQLTEADLALTDAVALEEDTEFDVVNVRPLLYFPGRREREAHVCCSGWCERCRVCVSAGCDVHDARGVHLEQSEWLVGVHSTSRASTLEVVSIVGSIGELLLNAGGRPRGGLAYASVGLSLGSFVEPI